MVLCDQLHFNLAYRLCTISSTGQAVPIRGSVIGKGSLQSYPTPHLFCQCVESFSGTRLYDIQCGSHWKGTCRRRGMLSLILVLIYCGYSCATGIANTNASSHCKSARTPEDIFWSLLSHLVAADIGNSAGGNSCF
jgi:hypothetical protein